MKHGDYDILNLLLFTCNKYNMYNIPLLILQYDY